MRAATARLLDVCFVLLCLLNGAMVVYGVDVWTAMFSDGVLYLAFNVAAAIGEGPPTIAATTATMGCICVLPLFAAGALIVAMFFERVQRRVKFILLGTPIAAALLLTLLLRAHAFG